MPFDLHEKRDQDESIEGWSIWCDMPMTRRKSYHVVTSPGGEPRYKSRFFTDCARFLADNGISEYTLFWLTDESLPSAKVQGGISE